MSVSPATPTMVFIHSGDTVFSASFGQQELAVAGASRQRSGSRLRCDPGPGVSRAKSPTYADAVAPGQLQESHGTCGSIGRTAAIPPAWAMVRVDLTDDMSGYRLPPGAVAQVAVYSEHWQPIASFAASCCG